MTRINHSPLPDVGFRFARTLLLLSLVSLPFLAYVDYHNGYSLPAYAKIIVIFISLYVYFFCKNEDNQQLVRFGVATALLLMTLVGVFYKLDSYTGLIWVPVLPILFCYIVGAKSGIIYTGLYLAVYSLSYFNFEAVHNIPPIEFDVWAVSVGVLIFVLTVSILFQKEIDKGEIQLKEVAKFDFLTQVLNRRGFVPRVEEEILRLKRYGGSLSIIIVDIDNFKRVNDLHGHGVGDTILLEFTDLLVKFTRSTDLVARWGGEEFVVLAANTALDDCVELAEKLRSCVENNAFSTVGSVTSSFGVAQYRKGESWGTFLERGDDCLSDAKQAGKNCVVTDLSKDASITLKESSAII